MQGYMDQGNMISPKDTNKAPITNPKEMEIHELLNKEFLKIVLKMLNELQENVESNTTKIRKKYMSKMRFSIERWKSLKRTKFWS